MPLSEFQSTAKADVMPRPAQKQNTTKKGAIRNAHPDEQPLAIVLNQDAGTRSLLRTR
jgi:hypothetical protein